MTEQTVTLDRVDPDAARDRVGDLRRVYEIVYAEPPYRQGPEDADEFEDRFARQSEQDGFRLVIAVAGGRVVGFCYTIGLPAGRWWRGAQQDPPAELVDADKVAVVELVLLSPYRGRGLGRALLDEVLAGRPERWATLLAEPDAPARAIYAHWGWEKVGTVQSQPQWGADDALVLPLFRGHPPVSARSGPRATGNA